MIAAALVLAAVGGALIGAGIRFLVRAGRLERVLEAHDRDEADLEALAIVSEPRACGCRWVPCDKHADDLWRDIHGDAQ